MEYESNGDGSKILSIGGYLNRIRRYLKDIINNLKKKKNDTWKIELTISINFESSTDPD